MKPTLLPPGTEHLKLKCDILLLTFAFKFNLRCYMLGAFASSFVFLAGAHTRPHLSST